MELFLGHTMSCPLFLFLEFRKSSAVFSIMSLEWPSFGFTDYTVLIVPVILRVRVIPLSLPLSAFGLRIFLGKYLSLVFRPSSLVF